MATVALPRRTGGNLAVGVATLWLSGIVLLPLAAVVVKAFKKRGIKVLANVKVNGAENNGDGVLVRYDAALSTAGGTQVQTRRFEARVPADGTAATVAPGLNQAANQVALEVARWIGG